MSEEKILEDRDYFTIESTLAEYQAKQYERTIIQNRKKIYELERQILLHKLDEQSRKIESANSEITEAVIAETNAHSATLSCRKNLAEKYNITTENWGYDHTTGVIKY
jgi:DNA-binding protein H-NS